MEDLLSAIDTRADYEIMSVKIWRKRDKWPVENVRVIDFQSKLKERGWHCVIWGENVVEFSWIQNPEARGDEINMIVHRGNVV